MGRSLPQSAAPPCAPPAQTAPAARQSRRGRRRRSRRACGVGWRGQRGAAVSGASKATTSAHSNRGARDQAAGVDGQMRDNRHAHARKACGCLGERGGAPSCSPLEDAQLPVAWCARALLRCRVQERQQRVLSANVTHALRHAVKLLLDPARSGPGIGARTASARWRPAAHSSMQSPPVRVAMQPPRVAMRALAGPSCAP